MNWTFAFFMMKCLISAKVQSGLLLANDLCVLPLFAASAVYEHGCCECVAVLFKLLEKYPLLGRLVLHTVIVAGLGSPGGDYEMLDNHCSSC